MIYILAGHDRPAWFLHFENRYLDGLAVYRHLQFAAAFRANEQRFRTRRGFADPVPAVATVRPEHLIHHDSLHLFPPIVFLLYPGI